MGTLITNSDPDMAPEMYYRTISSKCNSNVRVLLVFPRYPLADISIVVYCPKMLRSVSPCPHASFLPSVSRR